MRSALFLLHPARFLYNQVGQFLSRVLSISFSSNGISYYRISISIPVQYSKYKFSITTTIDQMIKNIFLLKIIPSSQLEKNEAFFRIFVKITYSLIFLLVWSFGLQSRTVKTVAEPRSDTPSKFLTWAITFQQRQMKLKTVLSKDA